MSAISPYDSGHLFVAAIRILEHRHRLPPTVEQVASMTGLALEQAGRIRNNLLELGVIRKIESGNQTRLMIGDHLALEQLSRDTDSTGLDRELEKFHAKRRQMESRIETIKQQQEKKKKDLFAEIEKKLRQDITDK